MTEVAKALPGTEEGGEIVRLPGMERAGEEALPGSDVMGFEVVELSALGSEEGGIVGGLGFEGGEVVLMGVEGGMEGVGAPGGEDAAGGGGCEVGEGRGEVEALCEGVAGVTAPGEEAEVGGMGGVGGEEEEGALESDGGKEGGREFKKSEKR